MNSARPHTDGIHSDNTPTESMIETPSTFAAKLAAIRYVEPILPRDTESPEYVRWLKVQDDYIRKMTERPTLWSRFRALLGRIAGPLVLLVFVILTTFACAKMASGAEGRWIVAEVTAYCPCALCCGTEDKTTANNTSTDRVPYAFAADRSLPFGSRVYVPAGLGVLDRIRADERWFDVDDRGGALDTEARRYGVTRLDLRVREHWWAVRFGRRSLPVFISP